MLDSMRTHRGAFSEIGIVNADGPNPDRDMRAWWNAACAASASCPVDSTNKVQHVRAGTHPGALPCSETRGSR